MLTIRKKFKFQKIFKSEFLIAALAPRLTVNENVISRYENLNLGVDNYKEIKFQKIFKSEFVIEALAPRLTVNENGISMYGNLSLGVDNYKQIKF